MNRAATRRALAAVGILLVALLAGCARVGDRRAGVTTSHEPLPSATPADIVIDDGDYPSGPIRAHVGEPIIVANHATSVRSVTADDGSFDTGLIPAGQRAVLTVRTPGTYHYHSKYRPSLDGVLVVTK